MALERFELGPAVEAEMVKPRVVVVNFARVLSEVEFTTYLDATLHLVETRTPTVTIVNIAPQAIMPKSQRERQAAFFREHDVLFRARTLGMAYVTPSTPGWLALHAFFLVVPPNWPYYITRNLDEAVRWGELLVDAAHESGGRVGSA